MIASLSGTVLSIAVDHAVIDCEGIGFRFLATPRTLATLRRGERAAVLTHLAVKDDALTLYGFSSDDERALFLKLQSVSGLGPKLALACLGTLGSSELAAAVSRSDAKTLQSVPGVGKRMAERLILELKDKVTEFLPAGAEASDSETKLGELDGERSVVAAQVVEALAGLGFTERVAEPVVESVFAEDPDLTTAAALKAALAAMGGK